ncbi:MAG: ABC transporter permease [Candidatus Omnitrophica bacterium]|nr:ABC transporter permease [Candidatus Omnitrophota bacterium]
MIKSISNIGSSVVNVFKQTIDVICLLLDTCYYIFIGPFKKKTPKFASILEQMIFAGIQSFPITFFVALFTGIVIAMQSAYQLKVFGAEIFTASMVSVSMARELSPVLTGLVVAGRVGAAITAEISSMKVSEQIEALETMALDPVRFLVVPRVLALIIMLPCLTVLGDIVGVIGGFIVGVFSIGLNAYRYMDMSFEFLLFKDVWTGLVKSFVFGLVISLIGCYMGLNAKGGAEGVGRATTLSVVTSFILIILFDCLLTGLFYFINV